MSRFEIGDKVKMAGAPFTVEVLEIKPCDEPGGCQMGDGEVFRFTDPGGQGDDWMHTVEFEQV